MGNMGDRLTRWHPQLARRWLSTQNGDLFLGILRTNNKLFMLIDEIDRKAIKNKTGGLVNVLALAMQTVRFMRHEFMTNA